MTSVSKNVYINKIDETVNEYNNTYHRTNTMKTVFNKNNDKKSPKFKVGDNVRMSQIKTFLQKAIFQFSLNEFL